MVVPVIQHDRPQHRDSRPAENFFLLEHQAPVRLRLLVRHAFQVIFDLAAALLERRVNLIAVFGLRRHEVRL